MHLAIPQKDVFTDEQQPATASVLVQTNPGSTLAPEQVQAVVHLVASSIDGLDPDNVVGYQRWLGAMHKGIADGTITPPPAVEASRHHVAELGQAGRDVPHE